MYYLDYYCKHCGYACHELPGEYKCPECGNIMKRPNRKFETQISSVRTARFIFLLIFAGGFCIFVLTSYIGTVVYIIIVYFVRKRSNKRWRDKAIRIG